MSRSPTFPTLLLIAGLSALLGACAAPTETPPPAPTPGITVIAPSTPIPPPTATRTVTDTPPGLSPTPTRPMRTPAPTPTEPCSNDSLFLSDLTVPDDTVFAPGDPIDKRWSIQNTGTCDWDADYRLVYTSGNRLGARSEVALFPARSGAVATVQVLMTAPVEPGEYISRWQARSPEGNLFGAVVFIKIKVVTSPPPTTPGTSPAPA